jgi:DNA polymerase-4
VTIKVRYSDFTTITRIQSRPDYTNDSEDIVARAIKLLDKTEAGRRPIRLLGVSIHNFDRDDARASESEESSEARLPFE